MVEPVQGSSSTDPVPGKHRRLPSIFSAAAPVEATSESVKGEKTPPPPPAPRLVELGFYLGCQLRKTGLTPQQNKEAPSTKYSFIFPFIGQKIRQQEQCSFPAEV